jgi:transposase
MPASPLRSAPAHPSCSVTASAPIPLPRCCSPPRQFAMPHSEASFAALCGVSPIEASSGKTPRRRLNRGGDRQANSALYTIAIARLRLGRRTQDYVKRRVGEGKTCREAIRCLKRYICRDITTTRNTPATAQSAT